MKTFGSGKWRVSSDCLSRSGRADSRGVTQLATKPPEGSGVAGTRGPWKLSEDGPRRGRSSRAAGDAGLGVSLPRAENKTQSLYKGARELLKPRGPEGSQTHGGGTTELFRCCFSLWTNASSESRLCEAERPGFIQSWGEMGPRRRLRGRMLSTLGALVVFPPDIRQDSEASGCGMDRKGFKTKPKALKSSVGWVAVGRPLAQGASSHFPCRARKNIF